MHLLAYLSPLSNFWTFSRSTGEVRYNNCHYNSFTDFLNEFVLSLLSATILGIIFSSLGILSGLGMLMKKAIPITKIDPGSKVNAEVQKIEQEIEKLQKKKEKLDMM